MSMLKTGYNSLGVEGLKQPLEEISSACEVCGINFFIVGAIARNIWLAANDQNPSGTKDLDFGVFVSDDVTYNQLRDLLVKEYNYKPSTENVFCLITPEGIKIDLLPFGDIEIDSEVRIEGVGLTSIKLDGFKEIYEKGTIEVEIGNKRYKSCSIPGVVILKMIAYDDRPDRRIKDIQDIDSICQYYPSIEDNLIWSQHFDLYENDLEHFDIGMIVLGRGMNKMFSDNSALKSRIIEIINKAKSLESDFIRHMIKDPEKETVDMKRSILNNILQGLTEGDS